MSSGTFVDRIDPFAKRSLKKKSKKSQGSSRYRNAADAELQPLPLLKGRPKLKLKNFWFVEVAYAKKSHVVVLNLCFVSVF